MDIKLMQAALRESLNINDKQEEEEKLNDNSSTQDILSYGDFENLKKDNDLNFSQIRKKQNSLPKLKDGIKADIFSLLAQYSNSTNINVNIPASLVKIANIDTPYLVQTKKNGQVISRPCQLSEYLNLFAKKILAEGPLYIYKGLEKKTVPIYSKEGAESSFDSNQENSCLQNYIKCISSQVSVIRVLWKLNRKCKYFTIVNRKKICKKSREASKSPQNNSFNIKAKYGLPVNNFRYVSMIMQTSKSINNPYKVSPVSSPERMTSKLSDSLSTSKLLKVPVGDNTPIRRFEENNQDYVLNTESSDDVLIVQNFIRHPTIEAMMIEIASFLNKTIYKDEGVKGIIADFMRDSEKKWVLIGCKEVATNYQTPNTSTRAIKNSRRGSSNSNKTPLQSNKESSIQREKVNIEIKIEKEPGEKKELEMIHELPFKIRNTQKQQRDYTINTEEAFLEKWTKINAKLERVMNLNSPSIGSPKNTYLSDPDIRSYQSSSHLPKLQLPHLNHEASDSSNSLQCPYLRHRASSDSINLANSCTTSDVSRKLILDAVTKIDEMKMNTELAKVKSQNLVKKYGGNEFWTEFIKSLYRKIMGNSDLCKHFSNSDLRMIICGMCQIFNGNATFEFRRSVKKSHENRNIYGWEFDIYSELFQNTLNEFEIEEEDKQIIMKQITSMKCLICKY
ncbi:unnamed protein product [Blepharisma stoltei]|uniref:Uncharacterized protein n=1 Tax=Blepharisma stoltei TaxID=1481888 RepID=A0AAU9IWP1_9CILI|nr:unnamed protein product [Blepharisma stoltei]